MSFDVGGSEISSWREVLASVLEEEGQWIDSRLLKLKVKQVIKKRVEKRTRWKSE